MSFPRWFYTPLTLLVGGTLLAQEPVRPGGADVAVIIPDSLPDVPRTLTELLAARVPGLTVQRATGSIGAGSWVSLRDGAATRGGDPLIVVDGVRRARHVLAEAEFEYISMPGSYADFERRGPSPLDDIPVEDIERVEILRGPAAASAYGPDGRYGVIVVTTRTPGQNRPVAVSVGGGYASSPLQFDPAAVRVAGDGSPCARGEEGDYCLAVGTSRYAPLLDRPLVRAGTQRSVRVGVDRKISSVATAAAVSHERVGGVLPSDGRDQTSATARATMPLGPLRLGYAGQWTARGIALPNEDGVMIDPYNAGAAYFPRDCSPATPCGTDVASHGYGAGRSGVNADWLDEVGPRIRRMRTSHALSAVIAPAAGVRLETHLSGDWFRQRIRWAQPAPNASTRAQRMRRATARFTAVEQEARFEFGNESHRYLSRADVRYERGEAERTFFAESPGYVTTPYGGYGYGFEYRVESRRGLDFQRLIGTVEQRLNAGRLDAGVGLTAVRLTDWSTDFDDPTLADPSADVALTLTDSPAHTLRFRAAVGRIRSFEPPPLALSGALYPAGMTRPDHLPDRLTEVEAGFDLVAGASRGTLTLYRRGERAERVVLAVPGGFGTPPQYDGTTRTVRGIEIAATGTLPIAGLRLHLDGMGAFEADRVTKPPEPWVVTYGRNGEFGAAKGESFASWYGAWMAWTDADADGVVDRGEFGERQSPRLAGRSRPSRLAALRADVIVAARWRVGAHLDYRGGHLVADAAERARCLARVCAPMHDVSASAAEQLGAWSAFTFPTARSFLVPGDAVRAREISLSYDGGILGPAIGATTLRITLAVKNAGFLWSRSKVWDPETSTAGVVDISNVEASVQAPIPREVVLRASLSY